MARTWWSAAPPPPIPTGRTSRPSCRTRIAAARSIAERTQRPGILASAEQQLTLWHAEAVTRFLRENGLDASGVDVIGFHGQTVIHRPERRLTVQLGLGQLLADRHRHPRRP